MPSHTSFKQGIQLTDMFGEGFSFGYNAFFGFLAAAVQVLILLGALIIAGKILELIFKAIKFIFYEMFKYITSLRVKQFLAKNPDALPRMIAAKEDYEKARGKKIWLYRDDYDQSAFVELAKKTGYPAFWIRIALQNDGREQRKREKKQMDKRDSKNK